MIFDGANMLKRNLITSKRQTLEIVSDLPEILQHFSDTNNYADVVLNQINQDRFYDPLFHEKDNLTILDIGGNIGLFSLYIHDRAKIVYSIEPTPSHFEKLKHLTQDYKNIKPLNIALHNKREMIQFYTCNNNSTMNSTVNRYSDSQTIEVQGKTLEDILVDENIEHVDFVKCDIEGSEMMALTFDTIDVVKDKIDNWFIEVHATDAKSIQDNRFELIKIFKKVGYNASAHGHDVILVSK